MMSGNKRKKRRKQSPWPLLAAVAVLGLCLWLLLTNAVFVVRQVQVVGSGEVPETDVLRLSSIRLGKPMNSVRESDVRLAVESDGRLAFVGLERQYPNRLLLTVRPRTRDALMLQGGRTLVLDSEAYVVQVAEQMPDARIPYVSGIKASFYNLGRQLDTADGRCPAMTSIIEALKAHSATPYASEINVENTEDLRIITRTGMTVLLGNAENMGDKIAWMAGALADLESRGEINGSLDVSSGTKADFKPEVTPEPDPMLYGYDQDAQPTAEPLPDGQTPSPAPAS